LQRAIQGAAPGADDHHSGQAVIFDKDGSAPPS
jgi:hypothetical protein